MMKKLTLGVATMLLALAVCGDYGARIRLDKKDGVYQLGETAKCKVTLLKDGKPLSGVNGRMCLRFEGKTLETKTFATTGKPMEFSFAAERPGWAYFGFEVLDENGKALKGKGVFRHRMKPTIVTEIGAMFNPEKIKTGVKRPADFEEFWQRQRVELDKVPVEATLTELDSGAKGIKLYAVEIKSSGTNPVTAYLAVPENAKPQSLPAQIDFLSWSSVDANRHIARNAAKRGMLGMAATWHGLPVNQPNAFYQKECAKFPHHFGIDDRDKWAFKDMYIRVMRALDYIKSRPEWDKKTLMVTGGSLGGAQTIIAAALDKDVTLAIVSVPCFVEFNGDVSRRCRSIPHRYLKRDKWNDKVWNTAGYFDMVNMAPMIKCETIVCTGFTDELCPPSNVFAFYNALPEATKKAISTNPRTGHYGMTRNVKGDARMQELFKSIKVRDYTAGD